MNPTSTSAAVGRRPRLGGRFLSFQLAGQAYAVAILQVHEIVGWAPVTALPRTPAHLLGVTNRRGRIVPVVDLRRRFDLEPTQPTDETCIVVVDVAAGADGSYRVGCVVDSVGGVTAIGDDEIQPAPACVNASTDYVAGLAQADERVVILLDIDRALADIDPAMLGREPTP